MINLIGRIPKEKFSLACSGGRDSMFFLNFLLKYKKNDFNLLYFNHGTEHGKDAQLFLEKKSKEFGLELIVGNISREKLKGESPEEYWRNERYNFFNTINNPIITCHHLSDCVETWIMSSLRGESKLIPYRREHIIRPFLMVSAEDMRCPVLHWIEDESNSDTKYTRNLIRHEMMPTVLKVNPGIEKTVKKKLLQRMTKSSAIPE